MSVVGNAGRWSPVFPPKLVPRILQLVVTGWDDFDVPDRREHEVPVTRRFRALLRQKRTLKKLPVAIDREVPEDDEAGEERGRIDLRFLHGYNEDAYFTFECKRLNVPKGKQRKTLAPQYVSEGMMRFINAQYAGTVTQGGMIGYVMDGKGQDAITLVGGAIRRSAKALRMRKGPRLSASLHRPKDGRVKETYHNLKQGTFRIHHVFLAVA